VIESLANVIADRRTKEVDENKVSRLLAAMESLSPEEIERLLRGGGQSSGRRTE